MKLKLFSIILVVILLSILGCVKPKKEYSISGTWTVNNEILIQMIENNLDMLEWHVDTFYYSGRRQQFNDLAEHANADEKYLKEYITNLEGDFRSHYPQNKAVDNQIQLVKGWIGSKSPEELYNDILLTELFYYNSVIDSKINREIISNTIGLELVNYPKEIMLGEQFEGDLIQTSYKYFGKKNIINLETYYCGQDTVLVHSDTVHFTADNYSELKHAFKPSKQGNYLLKGRNQYFIDGRYSELGYEVKVKVK